MKRLEKQLRKAMALALSLAMVMGLAPTMSGGVSMVQAATDTKTTSEPSVEVYATKKQMMGDTFAPDSDTGEAGHYGKIIFGKNDQGKAQEWYILGADSGVNGGENNTIIFAASPIATAKSFAIDMFDEITFDSKFGTYENGTEPTNVYPNHYGASQLRALLQGMTDGSNSSTTYFSATEQSMLNETTVTTTDTKKKATYTTTDQLYALDATAAGATTIQAGSKNQKTLSVNTYLYGTEAEFWLRTASDDNAYYGENVLIASPPNDTNNGGVNGAAGEYMKAVRPASNLDLTNVLFASAATAASTSNGEPGAIADEMAMTLRLDGSNMNIGSVTYNTVSGDIKITKGSTSYNVALVVQGNEKSNDWYYSKLITGNDTETVTVTEIQEAIATLTTGSSSLTASGLSSCKIWLEIKDTNGMIYAVEAEEEIHQHTVCNSTSCADPNHSQHAEEVKWTAVRSLDDITTAGYYYLTSDISLSDSWKPVDGVVLCLNGYSITKSGSGSNCLIYIEGGVTFTLTDCNDASGSVFNENDSAIDIDGPKKLDGNNEYVYDDSKSDAVFNLYGGTITASGTYSYGISADYAIVNMYGGTVTKCTSKGVCVGNQSTFNLYGGVISSNETTYGDGGGVSVSNSTFNMTGGEITKNIASHGGGIYARNSSLNISGGSITENHTSIYWYAAGAGVAGDQNTCVKLSGNVNITGNTTTTGAENNLVLKYTAGTQTYFLADSITIAGTLGDDFKVGVSGDANVDFTNGWSTYMQGKDPSNYFTSDNANYSVITSENGELQIRDTIAPEVEITLNTNVWKEFLSNVTFKLFFKDTKQVSITASDNVTASPTIFYYLSDKELTEDEIKAVDIEWQEYTNSFDINPNSKQIIYAKAKDEAGNTTIVNSDGIVVYTNAAANTQSVEYVKGVTKADVTAKVSLNGNTIASITNDDKTLASGTDYTVAIDDGIGTITLKEVYLESLSVGDYTLTVSYNPMGESFVEGDKNDDPAATELSLTVRNPKLLSITAPAAIENVTNGAEKNAAALGLPTRVTIETEDANITTAEVEWDLENLSKESYDPAVLTKQSFTVKGTVKLPQGVANPDEEELDVTVDVTVNAAGIVGAPTASPLAGTYTKNQSVILTSSTEGATIYYTTDGKDPSFDDDGKPNGNTKIYDSTTGISVTGTEGQSELTTIKAIAVKSGMQDSSVETFAYTIELPAPVVIAPSITTHPQNVSAKEGETATFIVDATGANLSYQWQINRNDGKGWVDIASSTSASHTTNVLNTTYIGFQYRCVVTNEGGSVTSEVATLTVTAEEESTPSTPDDDKNQGDDKDPNVDNSENNPELVSYKILDGADSSWTQKTDKVLVIRGEGEYSKFESVKVDGAVIDAGNYTVTEGSTIITLSADYLKTLSEGKHTFEITWTDGTASTAFTVAKNTAEDGNGSSNSGTGSSNNSGSTNDSNNVEQQNDQNISSAATGDSSNPALWMLLLALSLVVIAGTIAVRRKKN